MQVKNNEKITLNRNKTFSFIFSKNLHLYTEINFLRKMKFYFLYFIQFCIKCDQIWHKQRTVHDTIYGKVFKSQIL